MSFKSYGVLEIIHTCSHTQWKYVDCK